MLLVWSDGDENFFAQCANLGDSACVIEYVFMMSLLYLMYHPVSYECQIYLITRIIILWFSVVQNHTVEVLHL